MNRILVMAIILFPAVTPKGSHSLWLLATYIKEKTPLPQFWATMMLDDITVGYYDSETLIYVPRGNTTNEDNVIDLSHITRMKNYFHSNAVRRVSYENHTEGPVVYQVVGLCELLDGGRPGQVISKTAFRGSTTQEMHYFNKEFTHEGTEEVIQPILELYKWRHETFYSPTCITTLKKYLKTRGTQVNRKVKPKVRLIQKANTYSGGSRVSCLATGFYPRHINLTLFRDGQPVSNHEITGGDLLPNDDKTYQMRKSLEISAEEEREKHKYTCSAIHLSLDNKLDVTLEYNQREPIKFVMFSVLMVLLLVLVFGTGAALIIWRRRHEGVLASKNNGYFSASTSEESVITTS